MAPTELTVVLADDDDDVRSAMHALLGDADGIAVVAEADSAPTATRLCAEHRPDVAVLDVHMPGDGLVAAREILATLAGTGVVLLTADEAPELREAAAEAGIAEFVLKSNGEDLTAAVRRAGRR